LKMKFHIVSIVSKCSSCLAAKSSCLLSTGCKSWRICSTSISDRNNFWISQNFKK
jgi:hypothetical protein